MHEDHVLPTIIVTLFFSAVIAGAFIFFNEIGERRAQLRITKLHAEYHERHGFKEECEMCRAKAFTQFSYRK